MNTIPFLLQLEVTDFCPLKCPQCYNIERGWRHIPLGKAKQVISEGRLLGIKRVALNGGEPLLYPDILELLNYIQNEKISSIIYTSGMGLTTNLLRFYKSTNNAHICISLNGSTEKINSYSRAGFNYAINAMDQLRENGIDFSIVWVARQDNINDFENLISLAETKGATNIFVTLNRKNGFGVCDSQMSYSDYEKLSTMIRQHQGGVNIKVDLCFQPLLELIGEKSIAFKCPAGNYSYSVTLNGLYRPCTHINCVDAYESAAKYWEAIAGKYGKCECMSDY